MKKKTSTPVSTAASWRVLQGRGGGRGPRSAASRERRWQWLLRGGMAVLAVMALSMAVLLVIHLARTHTPRQATVAAQARLERIEFSTDGVLTRDWFLARYPDLPRSPLLAFDLHAMKADLESHGQVAGAHLAVQLPTTLRVTLQEREPVLRARVAGPDGRAQVLLVARDGTVYAGERYPRDALLRLPGLTGVTLQRAGDRYLPIAGMPLVASLLDDARRRLPGESRDWQLVSLARLRQPASLPGSRIEIHSRDGRVLVFAPGQFDAQLGRLHQVLALAGQRQPRAPTRIDLSFHDEVIVQY
jgi:hypothetical protein